MDVKRAEKTKPMGYEVLLDHYRKLQKEIEQQQTTIAELNEKRIQAATEGSEWKGRALKAEAVLRSLAEAIRNLTIFQGT